MTRPHVYKVEGIILKRRNVGETDRIVTVFTKQLGKIRVVAKGIRRVNSRRAPYLEIFSRVVLVINHGKNLDSVSEAQGITDFHLLRTDLGKVSLAYLFCELVDVLLADHQEHRDVFELLLSTLENLNRSQVMPNPILTRQFALELLWRLGFLPRGQRLQGKQLQNFIENIIEKSLRTPRFIRQLSFP